MEKIILSMVLVGMLFLVGCQYECPDCVCPEQKECPKCQVCEEVQIPKGKAMLSTDMYTWGINEDNLNELFFAYWLKNYGDEEAKNVKVRCKLVDVNNNVTVSVLHNFGNLASVSAELGQAIAKKSGVNMNVEYSGYCYVESCSNCEILYKRIPDLVEGYEIK